jgi:hypothetical protein
MSNHVSSKSLSLRAHREEESCDLLLPQRSFSTISDFEAKLEGMVFRDFCNQMDCFHSPT